MVTLTNHIIAGQDLHHAGPLALGRFSVRTIFLPNVGEDHKKCQDLSIGPLAGTAPYCGKSGLG